MTPLLFILLVTTILIIMLYWLMSSMDNRAKHQDIEGKQDYKFETAQELFRYVEPATKTKEENLLQLTAHPEYILAYWNISDDCWNYTLKSSEQVESRAELAIRLHKSDSSSSTFELPLKELNGTCHIKAQPNTMYYGIIGIVQQEEFIPLALSNTVTTRSDNKD